MKIKNKLGNFFSSLSKLPEITANFIKNAKNDISVVREKLYNLKDSNIDLGIYHVRQGNYKDALFRFKIVNKFIAPGNKKALYWTGICYFFIGNYAKAKEFLEKVPEEDLYKIMDFVEKIEELEAGKIKNLVLSDLLIEVFRDIKANKFIDQFADKKINLIREIIVTLIDNIKDLPDQYKILELSANIGVLGYEIRKRMQDKFTLDSVEVSNDMIMLQEKYFPRDTIYDNLANDSIANFLKAKNKDKYDVVFAFNGIYYNTDLSDFLGKIYKKIASNGYLVLVFKNRNKHVFDKNSLEFTYITSEVIEKITGKKFKILEQRKINFEKNNNYTIVVCYK